MSKTLSSISSSSRLAEPTELLPRSNSPQHRARSWSGLGLILLVAGAVAIPAVSASGGASGAAAGKIESNTTREGSAMTNERGQWTAERERKSDKIWLQFVRRGQDGVWVPLPAGQPASLTPGREVRFELRRAAGTFSFTGTFDGTGPGAKGAGTYTFQPDPQYAQEMESLGYRVPGGEKLLDLAIRDVSPAYARDLQGLGYRDLSLDRLVELRAHDVTPHMIRELADLGYRDLPAGRLLEFRMYDVNPTLIRELADLHYDQLPAERLVEFRIQDVTLKFIHELAELGYRGLSAEQLVELRVQGVDTAFIRDLQSQGHRNLSVAELIDLRLVRSVSSKPPLVRHRN